MAATEILHAHDPETKDIPAASVPTENSVASPKLQLLAVATWWFVSVSLHFLILALASLVSMAIEAPRSDDAVVMITELQPRTALQNDPEKKIDRTDVLALAHDTQAIDPASKESSAIEVPPDIMARAELGDHFETINPDRPDTHDAFGNPDAHSFHGVSGNNEPPGGGGADGIGMEELIGAGGAAGQGTGGGFGGGSGTGTGVEKGGGRGSFGNRSGGGRRLMIKKHGGSRATENAVERALQWLAYHQEPDGHWDSVKYGAPARCDTALTGLAALAFLGAGHTEQSGQWKENVQHAVAWMKSKQADNGRIYDAADTASWGPGYGTAMATLAIAEAAGMARIKETREAAQKAIDYCTEVHQNGDGPSEKKAWRYAARGGDEDMSVSGWFVMALKSAKVAGLHVNPASFEGAMKFVDRCERKAPGGDPGYGPASHYIYNPNPAAGQDFVTGRTCAIGNLCRQFMGWDKDKLQSSVELFVKEFGTPEWGAKKGDLYYWYYGTLCVFQQGGDVWKQWNDALKPALTDNQCKDGDNAGSWNPEGCGYEDRWGRVGQTAFGALCLEVYYRYQRLTDRQ